MNQQPMRTAPVTAIMAYDLSFWEEFVRLFRQVLVPEG